MSLRTAYVILIALISVSVVSVPRAWAEGRTRLRGRASPRRMIVADPRPKWPSWPRSAKRVRNVLASYRQRKPEPMEALVGPTPARARHLLFSSAEAKTLVAGWASLRTWFAQHLARVGRLGRPAFLLWGVHHDAGGQLDAFRRLFLRADAPLLHAIAVEHFDAQGRWLGIPAAEQRGDTQAISRYLATGAPQAWQQVNQSQLQHDYTAWKYGYLHTVMDLLSSARASGRTLHGCDMPQQLRSRLSHVLQGAPDAELLRLRMRELHCVLALRRTLMPRPSRIAMIWGQQHLESEGVRRFLPHDARVLSVYVVGHRPGPHGAEMALGRTLRLTDPVLMPLDDSSSTVLLLLAGPRLVASIDRHRRVLDAPLPSEQRHRLIIHAELAGEMHVAGQRFPVSRRRRSYVLAPGTWPFVLRIGRRIVAGALRMPDQGALDLEAQRDSLTLTVHQP